MLPNIKSAVLSDAVCFRSVVTICSDTPVSSNHFTQNLYVWAVFSVFLQPSLLSGSTIYIFSNWVTSAQQQRNLSFYLVLFSPHSASPKPAHHSPYGSTHFTHPHLGPCTYYACLSLRGRFFSEYCSNTELAINHIALSPRGASPRALPAHRAPPIGRWRSLFGLSERDIDVIINPASFLGAGDWEKGSLLEMSIMLSLVRRAFSAAACDELSAERRDALHTNRHIREQAN